MFTTGWILLPQYCNKSIFNVVTVHKELFGYPYCWNYVRSGNDKGPCDPMLKKEDRDTICRGFLHLGSNRENQDNLVTCQDYGRYEQFLTLKFSNACTATDTMKVHAMLPADTSLKILQIR